MTTVQARAATDRSVEPDPVITSPSAEIREAREADIPALAEVLARAFAEDPAMRFLIRRDDRRTTRLPSRRPGAPRRDDDPDLDLAPRPDLEHAWDRAVRHGGEHIAGRGVGHARAATSRPMPLDSGGSPTHHRASGRL